MFHKIIDAFDSVAVRLLRKYVPDEYLNIIGAVYAYILSRVMAYGKVLPPFTFSSGVSQHCSLSLFLFNITVDEFMETSFIEHTFEGVELLPIK